MNTQQAWNELCWYLVHTHPRQEDRVENNLRSAGIETLAPRVRERRCNSYTGAITQRTRPLFPSYVFARFRIGEVYNRVRYTRGVRCLVSFSDYPVVIDEEIISMIQSRIREDGFARMNRDESFKPGDEVIIKDGPFRNLAGVFEHEMKDTDRVRILLQTVSYQAHIEIERDLVVKLDRSGRNTDGATPLNATSGGGER